MGLGARSLWVPLSKFQAKGASLALEGSMSLSCQVYPVTGEAELVATLQNTWWYGIFWEEPRRALHGSVAQRHT